MSSLKFALLTHRIVCGLLGSILVLAGTIGFLLPYGIWPSAAGDLDGETLHIAQEASAGAIAVGLLAIWCLRNYDQAQPMLFVLLAFFALISLLHWVDFIRDDRNITSGLVNTIPMLLLMGVLALRSKSSLGYSTRDGEAA